MWLLEVRHKARCCWNDGKATTNAFRPRQQLWLQLLLQLQEQPVDLHSTANLLLNETYDGKNPGHITTKGVLSHIQTFTQYFTVFREKYEAQWYMDAVCKKLFAKYLLKHFKSAFRENVIFRLSRTNSETYLRGALSPHCQYPKMKHVKKDLIVHKF